MEGIVLAVIFYVLGLVFDKGKNKNKESFKEAGKNIKDRMNRLKGAVKKENRWEEEINLHHSSKEIDKEKYENIVQEKIVEKKIEEKYEVAKEKIKKETLKEKKEVFPLFQDSHDLVRGVILSEILSKPKSLK